VRSVAFSPTGEIIASGSDDKSVRLWNVNSGKQMKLIEGHESSVYAVAFSPTGEIIASGSDDKTVRLWNVQSGKQIAVLTGNLGSVHTVAFEPINGRYLVAAGAAGRLQFWDHHSGKTFLYRYNFAPGAWLDLLPDGRFDASAEGMRYLCYTEKGTFNSYTAEELAKEFYDPEGVQAVLSKYMEKDNSQNPSGF